jgi:hypothetical protein
MDCVVTGEYFCKCDRDNDHVGIIVTRQGTMRKLWTDHAVYIKFTTGAIISCSNGGENNSIEAIVPRLMHNQEDIGIEVAKYVGKDNGDKLTELLKVHIGLVVETMKKIKANDEEQTTTAIDNLLINGDQVADHIASFTGYDGEFLRYEFKKHNIYIVEMTLLRYIGKHTQEYEKYDSYYNHMLMLSDIIYSGINKM